jgi:exodeoxyribonuclease III
MPRTLKIATWNVNSIRMRLTHVIEWMKARKPDVLCLQETKVQDSEFPFAPFEDMGFYVSAFGQKSYNGVAILSASEPHDVRRGFPGDPEDAQRRYISAVVDGVRVASVYIPNGESVTSAKFAYKMDFLSRLESCFTADHSADEPFALCGDYNIAPEDIDLFDPKANRETVMFHSQEHAFLRRWKAWGLRDVVRESRPDETGLYSWWDYRTGGFARNRGWRIDHIWATPALAARCAATEIDRAERGKDKPSDHAPVVADFVCE